jgi:hypothetical protein
MLSLGEAYIVSCEIAREKERLASPLDAAIFIDKPYEGALGVDERWETSWVRTRGRGIEMCGRSMLWETLVRPVVVVLCPIGIEASLLRSEGL